MLGENAHMPEYVLSTFWIDEPVWDQHRLPPPAHLMCVPSVLLDGSLDDEVPLPPPLGSRR